MMTDGEDQKIDTKAEHKIKNSSKIELSNQESAIKHRKNKVVVAPFTPSIKEKIRITSYELYNMEKRLTKELFRPWNRSYPEELEDLSSMEGREKKMKEGRVVIEDEDHKLIQENTVIATTATTSRKRKEKIDSDYPMTIIKHLIMRFTDYVDNIDEMANHKHKSIDDWIRYFKVGIKVFEKINETLKKLMTYEMLRIREEEREKYIKVHEIMCQLEEMNAFLDGSHNIGIVTERDLTGIELWICELHMYRCRIDLDELKRVVMQRMHDFKHGTKD